jgi:signal transduction histidine kinase
MANFKTRARTLDLLGRQQIAGIPTAINELLKNAHDAYADKVDIDYFRLESLLVLRDDGIGMTKPDFESRWLTLGTESKVDHKKSNPPPVDESKQLRVSMGEKGIGRLAIASIGKQVLIVTKAKGSPEITAALINWQIFELPGLNLEDITVPVKTFYSLPTQEDIDSMKNELITSLDQLLNQDDITNEEYELIFSTISAFKYSPSDLNDRLITRNEFNELELGGTQFYVSPVEDTLKVDLDGSSTSGEATKIEKMLMGFHNTMTPDHPDPILDIVFRDYRSDDGTYTNVIDKEHFFTEEDFELADHHFKGNFDEFGQFHGEIRIYRDKTFDHIVNWRSNNFNKTSCGPFEINLAYIQGDKKHTLVDVENYSRIKAKSNKFGGLYVYKDNIRILPYGDSDYDYLEVEKRRSKHAGDAFFSYRRMFGIINLSQKQNFKLKEKAGREGFIEDAAYRHLRDILKNFFTQLAADFFRTDKDGEPLGIKTEAWVQKRNELISSHQALEKRNKQAKVRKKIFESALNKFFSDYQSGLIEQEINGVFIAAEQAFNIVYSEKDHDIASQMILDMESKTRQQLVDYRKSILISSPRGFLVRGELKADYEAYLSEMEQLDGSLFSTTFNKLALLVDNTIKDLAISVSKRKRLEEAVESISIEAKRINVEKKKNATESVNEINKRVKDLTTELMIDLDDQIRVVKDKFKNIPIENESDIDLVSKRNELANEITVISDRNTNILDTIIRQLEGIYWEKDEQNNFISNEQITDALGEELEELREKIHTDVELSQLGLAVSVIHHEFNSTVRSVRSSLKDLKAWSDVNEKLEGIHRNLSINFEHLDGYLNLFTPLNRRLSRKTEDIKLLEVKTFLIDLFKSRLTRHAIAFKHTKAFAKHQIRGFRSSFYPVFVNVIDNAIYWLNESGVEEKTIRLHADDVGSVYISNNGIEIPIQDKNKIFQLGFSRKENGRGMGLHISNEVLESAGYNLSLVEPRDGSTVTFKISRVVKDD